jgi:hypothetical protein
MEENQNEGFWVGPTQCDENRERRTSEIDEIWNKLKINHSRLGSAYQLFREALSCYQNGACMATALLCRASTEAALYLSVTRGKELEGRTPIDLTYLDSKYGEILSQALLKGIIDTSDETILNKIREKGNFPAHFAPILDRRIHKVLVGMKNGQSKNELTSLWLNEADAKNVLNWSVTILNHLNEKTGTSTSLKD